MTIKKGTAVYDPTDSWPDHPSAADTPAGVWLRANTTPWDDLVSPDSVSIRSHSSDMIGLGELANISEPVAVVIRPDGSVDVYGHIAVVDQRTAS